MREQGAQVNNRQLKQRVMLHFYSVHP